MRKTYERWLTSAALVLLTTPTQLRGQSPHTLAADGYPGLAEIEAACGALPCHVLITHPQTITLAAPHTLPANIDLEFRDSGLWTINGKPLTLSGTLTGPANSQIFAGTAPVLGLHIARPEWFVPTAAYPQDLPPEALRRAYESTVPGATILLNASAYISPFFDPQRGDCGGATTVLKTPRIFAGTTRPSIDSESNPTQLLAGTILRGEICGSTNIELHHLGVDVGARTAAQLFQGHKSFGIAILQTRAPNQAQRSVLEDVAVLSNNVADQHSAIFEGLDHLDIDHLWIWAPGGVHGLVLKSTNVTVHDFHCTGASNDCLIVKSDWATDAFGYSDNVSLDSVDIHAMQHPGDTGGIVLIAERDNVTRLSLTNVSEQGTAYGITQAASHFYSLRNLTLAHWTAAISSRDCLVLDRARYVDISSFRCTVVPAPTPIAVNDHPASLFTLDASYASLRNGVIACQAAANLCTTPAIATRGTAIQIASITVQGIDAPAVCTLDANNPTLRDLPSGTLHRCANPESFRQASHRRWVALKTNTKIWMLRLRTRFRRAVSSHL
jgi:hypothetical protein